MTRGTHWPHFPPVYVLGSSRLYLHLKYTICYTVIYQNNTTINPFIHFYCLQAVTQRFVYIQHVKFCDSLNGN